MMKSDLSYVNGRVKSNGTQVFDTMGKFSEITNDKHYPSFFKEQTGPAPKTQGYSFKLAMDSEMTAAKLNRDACREDPNIPLPGGDPRFIYNLSKEQAVNINLAKVMEKYHQLMNKTFYDLKKGRKTHDPTQDKNSPSAECMIAFLDLLRQNGISLANSSKAALFEATLQLIQLCKEQGYVVFDDEKLKMVHLMTVTCAGKDSERDRGKRRGIWIVTIIIKVLLTALECLADGLLEQMPEEVVTMGGIARDIKILQFDHNIMYQSMKETLRGDLDDRKFNELIQFIMMASMMAGLLDKKYKTLCEQLMTAVTCLRMRYIKLSKIALYYGDYKRIVEFSDMVYSMLSDDLKAMIGEEDFHSLVVEYKETGRMLGWDKMGMGMLNKLATVLKILLSRQARKIAREEEPLAFLDVLLASDDAKGIFDSVRTFAIYMTTLHLGGFQLSPEKCLMAIGSGEATTELTGKFCIEGQLSCNVNQEINQLRNSADSPAGLIKELASAVNAVTRSAGVLAGAKAVDVANKEINKVFYNNTRMDNLKKKGIYGISPLHKESPLDLDICASDPFYGFAAKHGITTYLEYYGLVQPAEEGEVRRGHRQSGEVDAEPGVYSMKMGASKMMDEKEENFKSDVKPIEEVCRKYKELMAQYAPAMLIARTGEASAKDMLFTALRAKYPHLSDEIDKARGESQHNRKYGKRTTEAKERMREEASRKRERDNNREMSSTDEEIDSRDMLKEKRRRVAHHERLRAKKRARVERKEKNRKNAGKRQRRDSD